MEIVIYVGQCYCYLAVVFQMPEKEESGRDKEVAPVGGPRILGGVK